MSFAELGEKSGIARDDLRGSIRELTAAGFLKDLGRDKAELAERSGAEAAALDEVVALYDSDKIRLVIAITEISMDRLRNLAGKAFADAFLIRKKSGGDDG